MSILGSEINDLKSVFSKRQGPAYSNRFMLFMTPPSASLLNLDVNAAITGVLGGGLSLGGFVNDPRDVSLLCESCTLPGRTVSTIDYQNVKQAVKIPYSFINEDVTFTFILTGDYYMRKMFDNWLNLVFDTENYQLRYKDTYTTDVRIAQLNKNNIPVYTVQLHNAYPTGINAITLDNTAESTIQKVTVNMTYETFVVEGLFDAAKGVMKGLAGTAANTLGQVAGGLGKLGL
jgi:hypothetical protein